MVSVFVVACYVPVFCKTAAKTMKIWWGGVRSRCSVLKTCPRGWYHGARLVAVGRVHRYWLSHPPVCDIHMVPIFVVALCLSILQSKPKDPQLLNGVIRGQKGTSYECLTRVYLANFTTFPACGAWKREYQGHKVDHC